MNCRHRGVSLWVAAAVALVGASGIGSAFGADGKAADGAAAEKVTYVKDIQPILKESCVGCHKAPAANRGPGAGRGPAGAPGGRPGAGRGPGGGPGGPGGGGPGMRGPAGGLRLDD